MLLLKFLLSGLDGIVEELLFIQKDAWPCCPQNPIDSYTIKNVQLHQEIM